MFAIRRSRPSRLFSTTANLQTNSPTVSVPESVEKRRTRPLKTRRPRISLEHPREWKRPLAYGVLPAYDEALKFIKADSEMLKREMQDLQASLTAAREAPQPDATAIEQLEDRINYLEIQSKINFPEVQWKCANGMADLSQAVDRQIIEQRWRKEGPLDLLMERIYQMHVVPDLVPELRPSFDLRISFPDNQTTTSSKESKYNFVEPGSYLLPEQTIHPPRLHKDVFHTDERLYTLIMVDPDVPDEANGTYQPFLHWLQPNIPLSATSPAQISNINTHTTYIPPHPQKGTPYHRYTILLLPQKSRIDVPAVKTEQRLGFSVRRFMAEYQLDSSIGGGAHMWRQVWNPAVSCIYRDVLRREEPVYGKPPKADRYADVRGKNRALAMAHPVEQFLRSITSALSPFTARSKYSESCILSLSISSREPFLILNLLGSLTKRDQAVAENASGKKPKLDDESVIFKGMLRLMTNSSLVIPGVVY